MIGCKSRSGDDAAGHSILNRAPRSKLSDLVEFTETKLKGAFLISLKKIQDDRGFFARGWCREEFTRHGLNADMVQLNVGFSRSKGTLRGLHYQNPPQQEGKFVRCTRGAIFDVIVDLRPDSPTHRQWFGAELTADNGLMLYSPEGFAQGYQTLEADSEMYYLTSGYYLPTAARGVRYNDPAFQISWPLPVAAISDADKNWPDYLPGTR
jgi:dTDP-4-dehydrorhamnose 3,5-epimerase